ncbi:alginate lyase family protein [Haloarcula litorea]|uniref:alginate lyase family protein n=1 Tax=Haloarcula litorea TaxID=3032579 RepID=UPI0023E868BC|nr:alginate lyase family protein [Halomicroarcula sp. GDY20]
MTDDDRSRRLTRRALLHAGAGTAVALAGCSWFSDDDREPPPVTETPETPPTTDGRGTRTRSPTEPASRFDGHYVFVSDEQLRGIRERLAAEAEPWHSGYGSLYGSAEAALSMDPRSIVDDGAPRWDDPHRFGEDEDRHDYRAAMEMTAAARDTALAYRFSDEDRFARRSIDLISHWCLDEETRMKPVAKDLWAGPAISLWITIPDFWYAASLLRGHPHWRDGGVDREAEFRSWVRSFVDSIEDPGYFQYNNIWAWRIQTLASAAVYLRDEALFDSALEMWRAERNWRDYRRKGEGIGALRKELNREDGFSYHVYGMKALTMTAEIARHQGIDLYGYNAPTDPADGSTLRKLYRFMLPYLADPDSWRWGLGNNGLVDYERRGFASLYELAYSRWADREFREVVGLVGRPVSDGRLLGCTTLTHGNLFEFDDIEQPVIDG